MISPYDSQDLKVLVADNFDKRGLLDMENEGMEVAYNAGLEGQDLAAALAEEQPEVLLVRSTQVDRAVIDAAENLQLVVRAGTGYDNIDH